MLFIAWIQGQDVHLLKRGIMSQTGWVDEEAAEWDSLSLKDIRGWDWAIGEKLALV